MTAAAADKIKKAIDFIEEGLSDETLSLDAVARHAGYSSWHFQRLFGALTGLSLKEYIRRRRLTEAYEVLSAGSEAPRLLDLALDCGFESQEAFSRAFKKQFGMTPGACREAKGGLLLLAARAPRFTAAYLDHVFGGISMVPELIECSEMYVAGPAGNIIGASSPEMNTHAVIPKLWDVFFARLAEIPHRADDKAFYGLIYSLQPPHVKEHPEEMRYLAGARVTSGDQLPQGLELKTVPAGRYAKFIHKGKLDTFAHTMRYILGSWLPKSGMELRDAPDLEVYGDKFVMGSDESELAVLIPVR